MKKQFEVAVLLALILGVLSVSILIVLNSNKPALNSNATKYTYTIVQTYPHDTGAFTEGLIYVDGFLYESTGLNGYSSLRRVALENGDVAQKVLLPDEYYGEGITTVNDTIVLLTWQSHIGFVYNKTTFALIENFTYPTEGWGLTFDGERLIMSDGSDKLFFLDPITFQSIGQIQIRDGNVSVLNINELEYVNGDVYANIWKQQKIAIINPETGQIKAWIDLTGLQDSTSLGYEEVLNGIAYDPILNRLFVTGKNWPHLFEIKLLPTN
jgi:glutamine cyclotransferase